MSAVSTVIVGEAEDGLRLDRWFRRHYPGLKHGRLEKLLRTGQIRVDGGRARAATRLAQGQSVRVPPLGMVEPAPAQQAPPVSDEERRMLAERIIYQDDDVIAFDKPAGLAVQGGSKTRRHLDGLLSAFASDDGERPKLVHRLDKETSGVVVVARSARSATRLSAAFQRRDAHKLYWALVRGVPRPAEGTIDRAIAKTPGPGGERMRARDDGLRAVSRYRVIDRAGRRVAWLGLAPLTGRTHQLRIHCALLGTPILGESKYGEAAANDDPAIARRLHLHAKALDLPHPSRGGRLRLVAPLPAELEASWSFYGFEPNDPAGAIDDDWLN